MHRREFLKAGLAGPLVAGACGRHRSGPEAVSHRLMAQDKGRVAVVGADGYVEWSWENGAIAHDMHLLPNGNLLGHDRRADPGEGGRLAGGPRPFQTRSRRSRSMRSSDLRTA